MIRATTSGVLKGYRVNLNKSAMQLNSSRDTVLTQRNFNTYAEDPAAAAQSFQLRRSFLEVDAQSNVSQSVMRKYDTGYGAVDSVVSMVDNKLAGSAWSAVLSGATDTTGAGRTALGQELMQLADSIVQTMNCKYGDHYVFSGADGLNIPFTWDEATGKLCYRGNPVDVKEGTPEYETLAYLSDDEKRFVDIGIGLKEDENGDLIQSSAFDSALQGINFLGWGEDAEGDPRNIASLIKRMGQLLSNCDEDTGKWATNADQQEYMRLAEKFSTVATELKKSHVTLTTQASFLQDNQELLENTAYNLNEQIIAIEQCDLADAITSFSWAQYCYNAALKMGNSILSETLMDYIK